MAANKRRSEVLLLLPPLKDCHPQNVKHKARKKFGNFGTYIMLPAVDPTQNINAFYGVKRICKFVCEWYSSWRPWQREVLLCSLSGKCSVSQLSSLSTILEPVFHRDFLSRLYGKYPVKNLKAKLVHNMISDLEAKNGKKEDIDRQGKETDKSSVIEQQKSTAETWGIQETGECGKELEMPVHDSNEGQLSDILEQFEVDQKGERNPDHTISLTDLVKQNIMSTYANDKTQERLCQHEALGEPLQDGIADHLIYRMPPQNSDGMDLGRSFHVHTANTYQPEQSRRFFSASQSRTVGEMKATLPYDNQYQLRQQLSDLDQRCYKHKRWWSEPKKSKLVSAHGFKLWTHFTRQLKEINKRMDEWRDHERVNLLSEVIKSSDPEQVSFFAQCLIQRLRDRTDVTILPDHIILKIFSKLDGKSLHKVSQVTRRWRYLGEDANLWKQKCFQLGQSKGIKNLNLLIEKSASNRYIDWKQAYQEVHKIFLEKQDVKDEDEAEVVVESVEISENKVLTIDRITKLYPCTYNKKTPKHNITDQVATQANADLEIEHSAESTETTACTEQQEPGLMKDKEDIDSDDGDLTGGSLKLLEKSLLELTEVKSPEKHDEFAIDIRPNKVQADNEMEMNGKDKYQYITVGVEDVKSLKRVRKLQGHMDAVLSLQFDSKRCLTGSADRVLRMWDVRSGRGIRKMLGHAGGIRCVQFDNNKIMSGSWDTSIMVWDIVKFTRLGVLSGHTGCVSCLRFNSKYIVSGSHDMTIRIWNANTWECLQVLHGHTGEVTCLFLGGIFLLTGSTDRTLKLWNIETGECLKTLVGHKSTVLSVQASRALVISSSEQGKIMFWDLERCRSVAVIQGHDGPCNCLFVWKNHLLSGGEDHLVKQWDIGTLTCLRTLQGHKGPVYCVKMSSRRIVSSSEDGTVRIWDLEVSVQQISRQFDEVEDTLLPFTTLEPGDEENLRDEPGGRRKSELQPINKIS